MALPKNAWQKLYHFRRRIDKEEFVRLSCLLRSVTMPSGIERDGLFYLTKEVCSVIVLLIVAIWR